MYRVFTRSAKNFEQFARATKRTVRKGLTYDEARQLCVTSNNSRTPSQVSRGTKYEFESY